MYNCSTVQLYFSALDYEADCVNGECDTENGELVDPENPDPVVEGSTRNQASMALCPPV
jgi:hypothetical protein